MKNVLSFFLQISLFAIGYLGTSKDITKAQVTTDGTVNTQVTQDGNVTEITGGETRGSNLFHSFQDFSINTGDEAFFNNANDISNIFSRVTGGNISNIDGAIRANGNASLFLINPAGIIFGENASLNIGGSFYASTASSILFENGEFSAADFENPPLLTVNAPIGFGFRDEPGDIVNRSVVQDGTEEVIGLEVLSGRNLTFLGGNLNFDGGNLTASGGDIHLGAVSDSGTVAIGEDVRLGFAEDISRGDITFSNASEVDVRGTGGGNIKIDARNLNLEGGERGVSQIRAGIRDDSISIESQAGDITVDATGNISLIEARITNNQEGIGNGGNVFITTDSLSILNGSDVASNTFGQGNAGVLDITATGDIIVDGEGSGGFVSGITSLVNPDGEGNSGELTITTANLNLTAGGVISADTFGTGNAGAVRVTAREDITIDGENSDGIPSGIRSVVNPGAEGSSGGITITTANLNLIAGSRVDASTFGTENAGAVEVKATGDITIDGENSGGFVSGINSQVSSDGEGSSGGVTLTTNNLNLTTGGTISASTFGNGNAGAVEVTAIGGITVDGEDSDGIPSNISSQVNSGAEGNSGGVTITTANLNLIAGGRVSASTLGTGDAGAVRVKATEDITIDGEASDGIPSGISSVVNPGVEGSSGGVIISTSNLNLTTGSTISADTFGNGNAGVVEVTATGDITVDGENSGGFSSGITSLVSLDAEGNSGGVTLTTSNLNLTAGGTIGAGTLGTGNAGAVDVTATGDITIDGENSGAFPSNINSQVNLDAEGSSGGITLTTSNLNLTAGGTIGADTLGNGNAGAVDVTATGDISVDGENSGGFSSGITSGVNLDAEGSSGGVTLTTSNLNLTAGGRVDASTFGTGDANNATINATKSILIDGFIERFRSGISANALNGNGNGGNIFITTGNLTIANGGTIEATNFDNLRDDNPPGTGQPGAINITANAIDLNDLARIEAETQSTEAESAIINLNVAEDIRLDNNSFISAEAFNNADGGNLNIDTRFIIAFPNGSNDIIANAERGNGGNINISAESLFGIAVRPLNGATNDINASSAFSLDGNVTISTPDINPVQGVTELQTNVVIREDANTKVCQSNREESQKNGLKITGKGGVPPAPELALDSQIIAINGQETDTLSEKPQEIKTSKGKIQPARGINVTESGEVILTAHRTNNLGDRLPEIKRNCG